MKKFELGLAIAAVVAVPQVSAITYHVDVNGLTAAAGSQFIASGGNLELKNHNGFNGLGISGGGSGGEIDLGQKLTINFLTPQVVEDFTVVFLYDGPEYADGHEVAAIRVNGSTEYQLTATGSTSASWTGSGSVANLSPATSDGGAIWKITNPFSATPITSIELYPLVYPVGQEAPNPSDFSLRAFNTSAVPDGGSMASLLGLSAFALTVLRRKMSS